MEAETADLDAVVSTIRDDERVYDALEGAVDVHEEQQDSERWEEYDHAGFTYSDVGAPPWALSQLHQVGILEGTYTETNATNQYRVADVDLARKALIMAAPDPADHPSADVEEPEGAVEPAELFQDIVGHEECLKWLRRTVEERATVHHLLYGPSGSGKTTITDDILRLPGAELVVGSGRQATAAGVTDVLVANKPDWLVVEEIEKMSKSDAEALLTLMGNGYIKQTKADGTTGARVELDTVVIATANDYSKVSPDSLKSRFMEWRFEAYSLQEFVDVCQETLPRDYDVDDDLAETIALEVESRLGSTDPRDAERVAQLAADEEEVVEIVEALA